MSAKSRPLALMIQGTGSDVGKSLLVAGLARAFVRRGLVVRPFKPQNMSNNAAVTADGGEIGRAQALQARACKTVPTRHMNPVLLKPQSETGSQVVVQGRVLTNAAARDYHRLKPSLLPKVLESFALVSQDADLVLVEGAGSAAEINLRDADIANMGFAEAADIGVILVADIDRGGVLAQIVGTWNLVSESERNRIKGYVINKFRGDLGLFTPALDIIGQKTGLPCLGVVPFFSQAARLPAEDGASLKSGATTTQNRPVTIAVPRLPRIANFDDFDPLAAEPGVRLVMVGPGQPLPTDADVIVLPGSKSTIGDLDFLVAQGWDIDIKAHARQGKMVVGICAGYQMLGRWVADPLGVEGPLGQRLAGLGLLDVQTEMAGDKVLTACTGHDVAGGRDVTGYEMHMGRTQGPDCARPWLMLDGRPDGAVSADGRIMGCYLHGLFGQDPFRRAFLNHIRAGSGSDLAYEQGIEQTLDALAEHLETHMDLDRLLGTGGHVGQAGRRM